MAANYLDIKGLLDVTCKTVADMIKGKTPEEIRKTFNIKNDFTPRYSSQSPNLKKSVYITLFFTSVRRSKCERRTSGARRSNSTKDEKPT